MTPCDVFPYLRGRTTWLVGDSMQQARPLVAFKDMIQSFVVLWRDAGIAGAQEHFA